MAQGSAMIQDAPAAATTPPASMQFSDEQFKTLMALLEHRHDLIDSRHNLTQPQKDANVAFQRAAIGMAIRGFNAPAKPMTRDGNNLYTEFPLEAKRARIFSRLGFHLVDIKDLATIDVKSLEANDQIMFVEFLGADGALVGIADVEVAR